MRSKINKNCLLTLSALCLMITLGNYAFAHPIITNRSGNAGVVLGPCGRANADGPTGSNDDFTNRSVTKGIFNVPPGGITTSPDVVVFRNSVLNVGGDDDAFIVSVPFVSTGLSVEISTDDGQHYLAIGSTTKSVTIPLSYHAAATFFVRITAPAGLKVLTGFDTVIRATSSVDSAVTNETIDRLYTGFVRLDRTATVVNAPGRSVGDASPGAEIEFVITYWNVSTARGIGSSTLTASNLFIYENGNAEPNNWGSTTEHIVGASDNHGGHIDGDHPGSTSLTDIVMTLEAGQSGVFKFRRRIKERPLNFELPDARLNLACTGYWNRPASSVADRSPSQCALGQ